MNGDGEIDCRQRDDLDATGWTRRLHRPEHDHLPAAVGEQLVGVTPPGWSRAYLGRKRGIQRRHRGVVPFERLIQLHLPFDRSDRTHRHRTQLDLYLGRIGAQQPAQRCDGRPRAVQLILETLQMARDHLGTLFRIVSGEDGRHLGQWHVELPQLVDHLCGRDLLGRESGNP